MLQKAALFAIATSLMITCGCSGKAPINNISEPMQSSSSIDIEEESDADMPETNISPPSEDEAMEIIANAADMMDSVQSYSGEKNMVIDVDIDADRFLSNKAEEEKGVVMQNIDDWSIHQDKNMRYTYVRENGVRTETELKETILGDSSAKQQKQYLLKTDDGYDYYKYDGVSWTKQILDDTFNEKEHTDKVIKAFGDGEIAINAVITQDDALEFEGTITGDLLKNALIGENFISQIPGDWSDATASISLTIRNNIPEKYEILVENISTSALTELLGNHFNDSVEMRSIKMTNEFVKFNNTQEIQLPQNVQESARTTETGITMEIAESER